MEYTTDLMSEFGRKAPAPKPSAPKQASKKEAVATETVRNREEPPTPSESPKPKKQSAPKKQESTKKEQKPKEDLRVRASTATPSKKKVSKEDRKTEKKNDGEEKLRSAKPMHVVMPYVLAALAVLIGISLLLNLFCNFDNQLREDPSSHWMGKIGYYICYALFGIFGGAVFTLPLILLNLSIYWKKYVDHRLTISKIVASFLFLVALSSMIHIFVLIGVADSAKNLSAGDLMAYGAMMRGGGVIGGKVGYLLFQYGSYTGGILISAVILVASLFYFLGMTPQNLWNRFRMNRAAKKERARSLSQEDAENAKNRAAMDEKFRRTAGRQMTTDDVDPDGSPAGAVRAADGKKDRSPEDKLAPMPVPRLDPNDGSRPFIPSGVRSKMNEGNPEQPHPTAQPAVPTTAQQHATEVAASSAPAPAQTAGASEEKPALDPTRNRDAAVDPIFPKSNENRQVRRVPKGYRNFDLKNIFVDLDDRAPSAPKKHAPLPPEMPMEGTPRPAASASSRVATPAPSARAAAPVPTAGQTAPRTGKLVVENKAPASRPAPATRPAPAGREAVVPGNVKTVFRQANAPKEQKFGLSDEEFEKLEAQQTSPADKPSKKSAAKAAAKKTDEQKKKEPTAPPAPPKQEYVFPPISYLQPGEPMTAENRAEIEASMQMLADTLASFRVRVQEINYSCGPTVTRYEVVLAPGVRVRTVTALADDIALALRSSGGVRIEAPIPGTNAVGIEVPNRTRSTIYLRDLIESKEFSSSGSKLSACLGADIAGSPIIFDIAKMPHLLVAGTTGSGKSVCINCIIMSLLYKVRPDEVKLILIDPKKVEFSIYKNIPHLMAPVVTMPKDAAGALQAAVEEMERRFELFENVGVRDLKGYNDITKDDPDMPKLPHMVIIIDELADLMMTAKNEVETAICRIAQKARAAGMHLIIGTQRPSADVVTGLIKANVPSSIAFAVKSQIDSRVILDHGGAEALTGKGDMLFVPIGAMRDTRVQGAFVSDKEVEKICEFIRATNGTAQYDEKFISKLKELAAQCGGSKAKNDDLPVGADGEKADDPKYADAVRIAIEEKRISTSLLQRKLEVGYSRAAKLIDRMQSEGIVSPPDGSKPRTILITPEEYLERFFSESEPAEQ